MVTTSLLRLLSTHPLVFFHLVTAFTALILGGLVLARRKGTASHKALGWAWVLMMGGTALASAFIRDYQMPNLFGFTPIHGFTLLVAVKLPQGIWYIRHGNVMATARPCAACTSALACWPASSPCCRVAFSATCSGSTPWA